MVIIMISKQYISEKLNNYPYKIEVRDTVTSTNSIMKEAAKNGAEAYSVLIASSQTEGRGRMGRAFYSPAGSGLYMSVLFRPENGINPLRITTNAAVAVATALEKLSGKQTGIKWVNDIYINDRKVSGILAESSVGENGFVVLGIGVNVFNPEKGFPDDIKMRAGSVFDKNEEFLREKTAVEILKELCAERKEKEILEDYRNRSIIVGKKIEIIKNDFIEKAVALLIDDDYSLVVKKEDGSIENISCGDVSIRI